jgi:hypothetical protein
MKQPYPVSIPIRFEGYPSAFKLICGAGIPAPLSYGSRVILSRTPRCGVVQGSYVSGASLPDYAMIYSDTGSDTDFTFKCSDYGWGTFFVKRPTDAYCTLEVRKGRRIECGSLANKFEINELWETLIPASTVLTADEIAKHVAVRYVEPDDSEEETYTLTWHVGYSTEYGAYLYATGGPLSIKGSPGF